MHRVIYHDNGDGHAYNLLSIAKTKEELCSEFIIPSIVPPNLEDEIAAARGQSSLDSPSKNLTMKLMSKDHSTVVKHDGSRLAVLVRSPMHAISTMSNWLNQTQNMSVNTAQTSGLPSGGGDNLFALQFELPKSKKKVFTDGDGLLFRVLIKIISERLQKFLMLSTSQVKKSTVADSIAMIKRLM